MITEVLPLQNFNSIFLIWLYFTSSAITGVITVLQISRPVKRNLLFVEINERSLLFKFCSKVYEFHSIRVFRRENLVFMTRLSLYTLGRKGWWQGFGPKVRGRGTYKLKIMNRNFIIYIETYKFKLCSRKG